MNDTFFIDKKARSLNKSDVGKVFVCMLPNTTNDSIGKYKILLSANPKQLYAFRTFNLSNGIIEPKMTISNRIGPYYKEVKIDLELISEAIKKCKLYMSEYRKLSIENQKNNELKQKLLRSKFNKTDNYFFAEEGIINDSNWYIWILWDTGEICFEIAKSDEVKYSKKFKWSYKPSFGISIEDKNKIFGINGLIKKIEKEQE